MLDERPTAAELVAAVADFLERKAVPQLTDSHTAFHAKVAVNALRIVERELRAGPDLAERARLLALCGDRVAADADLNTLNRALCALISDGRIATDDPALLEHLQRSVQARLAIDNPKYPSLKHV